jgi:hypothetical protein
MPQHSTFEHACVYIPTTDQDGEVLNLKAPHMRSQVYDAPRWAAHRAVEVHTVHRASTDKENQEGKQERYSRISSKISVEKNWNSKFAQRISREMTTMV